MSAEDWKAKTKKGVRDEEEYKKFASDNFVKRFNPIEYKKAKNKTTQMAQGVCGDCGAKMSKIIPKSAQEAVAEELQAAEPDIMKVVV